MNSTANLAPMSRKSNNKWKSKLPGQIFEEMQVQYSYIREAAQQVFIDEEGYRMLTKGASEIVPFWRHRASLIAADLTKRTQIQL